jgi:acetyl esterase/lipase
MTGSRDELFPLARSLADPGYVAVCIDYRLFMPVVNVNRWSAQLDDAQRAVRWLRANATTYGVDPDRIAAHGYSAGAALAIHLGVRETRDNSDPALASYSGRVNCVVDLAGEADLAVLAPDNAVSQTTAAYFGGTPEEVPDVYQDYSAVTHVDEDAVPFLVIHGAKDLDVPVAHSRRLAEALHEAGVEVVYLELPDGLHGDPAVSGISRPWVLTFLGVHLHPDT